MSVYSLFKKKQNRMLSKTWRTMLTAKEIEKNNYTVTGDLKKARAFAFLAAKYKAQPIEAIPESNPVVIYSAHA